MVVFQAITWEARDELLDEDTIQHHVSIFGKTEDGRSVCVTTQVLPYFYVRLGHAGMSLGRSIYAAIDERCPGGLVSCSVVRAKDIWGFTNNEEINFLRLDFANLASRRRANYILKKPIHLTGGSRKLRVYESNLDPVLRLMHETGIQSTGWLDASVACGKNNIAHVDVDLFCRDWKALKPVARDDIAPFVVCSFDIETNSSTGKFPNPDLYMDACFQIGASLCRFGEDAPYDKVCFCYKQTDPDIGDGTRILSYDTEKEMLLAFTAYVREMSCDVLTGWNIFGFDLQYIYKRAVLNTCVHDVMMFGRFKNRTCEMIEKRLSSSALGDNTLKLIPMPGRFVFDLFGEVKKGYKLDSYKLDNVSKLYLGDQKIDMPPKEMFARFKEGDPIKLRQVAEYCVKDTLLPHRLLKKLCTLVSLLEMAKATWVPLSFLVERGQQIKVFSQLTKKALESGFKVPALEYGSTPEQGYEGATVLDAQKGAYYTPITALDFASLYPSIMMAHNLCYSTLVMDHTFANIPGVEYETFGQHKFAQNVPSVLPEILNDLKAFRKQAKKDMANATSPAMKEVYNGKQLAYKISMNSMYGFTGASKGILPLMEIASTTTRKGRAMIEDTKNYVEANFPGAKVRYGDTDSVMVEFDVQGRTGQDAIDYSWELGERAAKECTALFKKPNDLELEKVYCPYFLYSKKRYAAKLWEMGKAGKVEFKYIDVKGLSLVRRDNTPHVRGVLKQLLDVILESSETDTPIKLARQRAIELLTGEVPNKDLILSAQLGDNYKNPNLAHVRCRDRMRERKPGSEPQSGDRVPYLLINTGDPKAKAYEKSEDPVYVEEEKLPIDYHYYFINKFLRPVCDLVEPLVDDPKNEIFGEIIESHKPQKKNKKKKDADPPPGQTTLDSWFKDYANISCKKE
jgi:DNA polymerase delta subunit 1